LSNKISIQEFDETNLLFIGEPINSWTDIKTEFGFIREYKKLKYYYDNKNNLTNVEVSYNCPQFPLHKKR